MRCSVFAPPSCLCWLTACGGGAPLADAGIETSDAATPDETGASDTGPVSTIRCGEPVSDATAEERAPTVFAGGLRGADVPGFCDGRGWTAVEGSLVIGGGGDDLPRGTLDLCDLRCVVSVGGDVDIRYQYELTSFAGLEHLRGIGGSLGIAANFAVDDLAPLGALESIGGDLSLATTGGPGALPFDRVTDFDGAARLYSMPLTSLRGFPHATSLTSLSIQETQITSLEGLDAVTRIDESVFLSQNALATLRGLDALSSVGAIDIDGNTSLASLSGLESLTRVATLQVRGNAALVDLRGLGGLAEVGNLSVYENAALVSVTGLDNLARATGHVHVSGSALTDLHSLGALTSIGGQLSIDGSALTSLEGLESLVSVGDGVGGTVTIGHNG